MIDYFQSTFFQHFVYLCLNGLSLHRLRVVERELYWFPKQWRKMVEWDEIAKVKDLPHPILHPERSKILPMLPWYTPTWGTEGVEKVSKFFPFPLFTGGLWRSGSRSIPRRRRLGRLARIMTPTERCTRPGNLRMRLRLAWNLRWTFLKSDNLPNWLVKLRTT